MDTLLKIFFDFKELLIIGIVLGGVFFVFSFVLAGKLTWKSRSSRLIGIFMGMNIREILWLSVGAIRILFVAVVCIFTLQLGIAHLAFFVALFLLSAFTYPKLSRLFIELINSVGIYAILIALGILIGYFKDINNNPMIVVVYVLLSIFAVLYSIYFYLKGISDLTVSKLDMEEWKAAKR